MREIGLKKIYQVLTFADKILILFFICSSVLFFIFFSSGNGNGKVTIIHHGKQIGEFPLDRDRIIPIEKGIEVEIKNGKARLSKDTSPLQIGVKQGWSNQLPIISVPSELVIQFSTDQQQLITY